jgi:hypothetical protein
MPRMIRKADEYRANAAECRLKAENANNAAERHMWRDMSESWLGMIDFAQQEDYAAELIQHGMKQPRTWPSH